MLSLPGSFPLGSIAGIPVRLHGEPVGAGLERLPRGPCSPSAPVGRVAHPRPAAPTAVTFPLVFAAALIAQSSLSWAGL